MTATDAKLANAASIEMYGNTMRAKGLHARAEWAYAQAREIRLSVLTGTIEKVDAKLAA